MTDDETPRSNGHRAPGSGDADGADRAAIEARDVELTYADGTEAVKGIDLTIPEGEFFGFLGPNGAGKTTAIKTFATLLSPTAGSITVNGYDVRSEARRVRETIGYMAQETSVDQELTARENIRFAARAYGVPKSERAERIDELLDLVDLADVADKEAGEFSGGMKKRLDAATALVHRPPLVFLDEPTTGLDPKARNRLWEYFERINERGTTLFLTTQYLEEADQLCDRISVILDGEIVATGSPMELKRRVGGEILDVEIADDGHESDAATAGAADVDPRERAAEIARTGDVFDDDADVALSDDGITVTAERAREHGTDLLVALRDAGLTVTGFNIRAPTLDDVFLAITGEELDSDDRSADRGDVAGPEVTAE